MTTAVNPIACRKSNENKILLPSSGRTTCTRHAVSDPDETARTGFRFGQKILEGTAGSLD
jgi:hypothetical protein